MPNLLMLGKQYEAYVTVLEGQAGGPLIYLDSHGVPHVVPTSPGSRRIAEELEPELKTLQVRVEGVVEKLHQLSHSAASVGA
jgi:nicotinamidase-related amidase